MGSSEIRVLVVDDDAAVRRVVVRTLSRHGHAATEVADGEGALALIDQQDFDVILLDQGLPDLPGTEVLRRLREARPTATVPVILVTGRGSVPERVEGLTAGANDYIVKPVDLDELVARVEAQVRGRDAWWTEVADSLSERAALAGALASIDEPGAADAATRVVELLVQVPELRRVAVVDLTPVLPVAIADSGEGPRAGAPGRRLHPIGGAELRQAIATRNGPISTQSAQRLLPGATDTVTVFGVEDRGEVVAALVVETAPAPSGRTSGRHADAAVADLLPVIDRVLGPLIRADRGLGASLADLRSVIDGRLFGPVFQPIVDLATNEVVGFEALTRFDDGTAPATRFTQAAHLGLGIDLELAALEAALEQSRLLPPDAYVSYNASADLIQSGRLAVPLEAADRSGVVLEITEHERIDDYDAVRDAVASLGEHVRLSVDDAGSGWASLRHVLSLRPDFVKLDRSWIHELDRDLARQALVLGIGGFVEQMGGRVVGEGIETEPELVTLRALGIHSGQGFYLGRPAPAGELGGD
ncbi:MAG: EAL domain-containing protein [Acidimicrobiia bacterium]|jgi:EAL domain-containing protein (putative c-di-GMP-specific phosphodiesterase class I)/DNA-binding NarL/FixJ family response regulator